MISSFIYLDYIVHWLFEKVLTKSGPPHFIPHKFSTLLYKTITEIEILSYIYSLANLSVHEQQSQTSSSAQGEVARAYFSFGDKSTSTI